MECGLIGPQLSGKSTLFDLLTGVAAPAIGRERRTRRGVAKLTEPRLDTLAQLFKSRKITPATVEFVDVPGIGGEEKQQPYPPNYLVEFRGADLLALVVREFFNPAVPHPAGGVDPKRDVADTAVEFIISDLATVEKRLERLAKQHDSASQHEAAILEKCQATLSEGQPLREIQLPSDEMKLLRTFGFLTLKPLLIVINLGEESAPNSEGLLLSLKQHFPATRGAALIGLAAGMETEINRLDEADRAAFMKDLGITEPALDKMIRATFELLGLITFFTGNENETRAWAIPAGSTALVAAEAIHADLARGFIRAEVCSVDNLVAAGGSSARLKEMGKLRLEGRDYIVADGDFLGIKFNV
jgi:hypothetical protein